MRLWFDEDLSPTLVHVARDHGFDATCNRDRDMLGCADHEIRRVIQNEMYVLVTDNAADFRPMNAREDAHPGLVVLPGTVRRDRQLELAAAVIEYIVECAGEAGEEPADYMLNTLVAIDEEGVCSVRDLPAA